MAKIKRKISIKDIAFLAMLGAIMFSSKIIMELLPNIHLIGVFVIAVTVVYRKYALYSIYVFVFLSGLFYGFASWWVAYLYVWTILWGVVMLLPKNLPNKVKPVIYMLVSGLHGLFYGILTSPVQALFFGLNLKGTLTWIAAGLPFDAVHGISNFICGITIPPIISVLQKAKTKT